MKITKEEFEKSKKWLILKIEEEAEVLKKKKEEEKTKTKTKFEYKAERKNIYNELEELFKNCYPKDYKKFYPVLLSIIDQGYSLLKPNDPTITQIPKELWKYQKHLNKLVEKKHNQLAEKYPDWFNDNIKLEVQLTHPFINKPLKHRPGKSQTDTMKSLGNYLKPCFPEKIATARKIAQIFLYFYGMETYPKGEIDPENIRKLM